MFTLLRAIKRLSSLGIVLIAIAAVAATATLVVVPQAVAIVTSSEGTAADLELDTLAERSSMFAADGTFLTLLTETENREPITLDEVPQEVIDSILAIEDSDFYEHNGLNPRATFRALVENVNAGGIAQGGSTITQQLVKNAILTNDQNLGRKSTEAFYALRLERQMTKDEILERYLNTVYFGAGANGIQAAAETYWGYTSASELGWAEAALLAGIIRSPTQFDPTRFPDEARARRSTVFRRLVTLGHITQEEADQLEFEVVPAERQKPFDTAPTDYFIQEALVEVLNDESILGGDASQRFNAVYRSGLKIYTTFEPKTQDAALKAREELLPDIRKNCYTRQKFGKDPDAACRPEFTVAVATLESHTGAVRALVGGPDFTEDRFNLATQGKRQPGSSMKTLVLAALFEAGFVPSDTVRTDGNCKFDNPGGVPDPYIVDKGRRGGGIRSIAAATRSSNNCAFVRLGTVAGNDKVIDVASRLGVDTSEMTPQLSLPLGSFEVVPMQMAGAYSAFANDGVYNEPWYIERIEDSDGNLIYEHRSAGSRAVSKQTARLIAETLESNVLSGTGKRAQIAEHHAAGKTGTTQKHHDAWFVGFTDYYTTAVWVGDPNQQERIEFPDYAEYGFGATGRGGWGGELPAAVWGHFMTAVHAGLTPVEFAKPDPYSGGSFLRAKGEFDFCNLGDSGNFTAVTEVVDSDGDGRADCYRPVAPPDTEPEPEDGDDQTNQNQPNGNGGNGNNRGGGNGRGTPPPPPPPPPPPTTQAPQPQPLPQPQPTSPSQP